MRWGAAQGEDRVGRVTGHCPYRVVSQGATGFAFPFERPAVAAERTRSGQEAVGVAVTLSEPVASHGSVLSASDREMNRSAFGEPEKCRGVQVSLEVEGLGSWVQGKMGVQRLYLSTPHRREPTFPAEVTGPLRGLRGGGESTCLRPLTPLRDLKLRVWGEVTPWSLEASTEFPSSHPNGHSAFFFLSFYVRGVLWDFLKSFMNSGLKTLELEDRGGGDTCLFYSTSSFSLIFAAQMGDPRGRTSRLMVGGTPHCCGPN